MQRETYQIDELDCAQECNLLRKAIGNHPGIQAIDFDVIHRRMTITYDPTVTDSERLLAQLRSSGMTAAKRGAKNISNVWQKKGRLMLCGLCGLLLATGLVLHVAFEGVSKPQGPLLYPPFLSTLFYLLAIACGGYFVLPRALISLKNRLLDIHVLMVVAVIGAVGIGQLFEAGVVIFLFSIALLLEGWSVERARRAISSLLELVPTLARVIRGDQLIEMSIEEVSIGERLLIRPGEKVPLDGTVISGSSSVNQAPITGESIPLSKGAGDQVFAGTVNEEGVLEITVTKSARDTTIARIIQMVEEAGSRRSQREKWIDRFSQVYTPTMIALAIATVLVFPLFFGQPPAEGIYRGLVLLVIACPCALVISTPVSIVSALTSAARLGVLIKGGVFLETAAHLTAIAFDKTGTVTKGEPTVQKIVPLDGYAEDELLQIAASLEASNGHPLARAIIAEARSRQLKLQGASDFASLQGLGAEGTIGSRRFWIGSHRLMHKEGQKEDPEAHDRALELEDCGHSVVAIGDFTRICGLISFSDTPRPYARETLSAIGDLGVEKQVMLTGDNAQTAKALAAEIGLTDYRAELSAQEKLVAIEALQVAYPCLAMVGDGVNDAPALASSSLGIAMGSLGSDAAFETADIVLMNDDLSQIPWLIRHGRKTLRIIRQNVIFSLCLKGLFILLALLGKATLWMAIASDTGATLLVVFNGLRLLKRAPWKFTANS